MMNERKFDRRGFIQRLGLTAGALSLGGFLPRRVMAQAGLDPSRKFLFAYFDGGWDILLGLDPRDPRTTTVEEHKIDVRYGALAATYQQRGVQTQGGLRFGPAVPPEFLSVATDFSIVNGIGMDTASHEVGRRFFITGQFPRGIQAVGSSTPSELTAQLGDTTPIPNMAAAVESYSRGLPAFATALPLNSLADLTVALTPFVQIDDAVLRAVQGYQDESLACGAQTLDAEGLASSVKRSQLRARRYIEDQLASIFDLGRQDAEMQALRTRYGLDAGLSIDSPEVFAFIAGQALKSGVSRCVSFQATRGLDTHASWAQDQAPAQERGWRALAAVVSDLKAAESTTNPGRSMFEETTILAFSEFGRTPLFNNLSGRDHHLGNSALIGGAGITPGLTVGASASVGMMPVDTDLETGAAVLDPEAKEASAGRIVTLSPKHVLATIFASASLDGSHLRADPIRALLRGS